MIVRNLDSEIYNSSNYNLIIEDSIKKKIISANTIKAVGFQALITIENFELQISAMLRYSVLANLFASALGPAVSLQNGQ